MRMGLNQVVETMAVLSFGMNANEVAMVFGSVFGLTFLTFRAGGV